MPKAPQREVAYITRAELVKKLMAAYQKGDHRFAYWDPRELQKLAEMSLDALNEITEDLLPRYQ